LSSGRLESWLYVGVTVISLAVSQMLFRQKRLRIIFNEEKILSEA